MPARPSGVHRAQITTDDPAKRRLPPLLRRAWYSLNQALRRRIAHLDITPDQFTVLRWLHEDETDGMTQRRLAGLMTSDPNTITALLNRMENADLIERRPHKKDRRANTIHLRVKGRRVFAEARQFALDLQSRVLGGLSTRDRERFLELLEQVANAAREASGSS